MTKKFEIKGAVRNNVENKLHEIMPNTNFDGIPEEVYEFAVQDVLETSAIGEGEDYYSSGDISLAVERTILHYFGHPEY